MHTHTPQGGDRWGGSAAEKGWVRCAHVRLAFMPKSGVCGPVVRLRGRTCARCVSPGWTGVGVSSVQTRFSSCCCKPLSCVPPPPDRCSHTTTSQLFMGPACFDFKYLSRRCSLLLCTEGGVRHAGDEALLDNYSSDKYENEDPQTRLSV